MNQQNLVFGQWVMCTHFTRTVKKEDGVLAWVVRPFRTPKRGLWLGYRDVMGAAGFVQTDSGLRPLDGAMRVQVVVFDETHNPAWIPLEYLEESA